MTMSSSRHQLQLQADLVARMQLKSSLDARAARERARQTAQRLASLLGLVASAVAMYDLALLTRIGSH